MVRDDGELSYVFLCFRAGKLPPFEDYSYGGEREEWTYTTAAGARIAVVWYKENGTAKFLYDENGAYVTVNIRCPDRAEAEALADTFDFHAACTGTPRVTEIVTAPPHGAEDVGDALSPAKLRATPEYRSWTSLLQEGGHIRDTDYQRSWSALVLAEKPDDGERGPLNELYMDRQELLEYLGHGDFLGDGFYGYAALWEDGSFGIGDSFYYLKKGSGTPRVDFTLGPEYRSVWRYETASGAVVTIATGCEFLSCSAVLYETEEAYVILVYHNADLEPYRLEAMADQWNWTALD